MNPEVFQLCDAFRDERLRLACGAAGAPSAAFEAHLSVCPRCRDELESATALVGAVQVALAPEPLAADFAARLDARLAAQASRRIIRAPLLWLRIAGVAVAAAALLLVLLVPARTAVKPPPRETPVVELSPTDAAELAAACLLVSFDDLTDEAIDELSERVADIAQRAESRGSRERGLPWKAEDDWDVPTSASNPSSAAPFSIARGVHRNPGRKSGDAVGGALWAEAPATCVAGIVGVGLKGGCEL